MRQSYSNSRAEVRRTAHHRTRDGRLAILWACTAALALSACAGPEALSPPERTPVKSPELSVNIDSLKRANRHLAIALTDDRELLASMVGTGLPGTCDIGTLVCGYSKINETNGRWDFETATYYNNPGPSLEWTMVAAAGWNRLRRNGGQLGPVGVLNCAGAYPAWGCLDFDAFTSTCATERNDASMGVLHTYVSVLGYPTHANTSDSKSCLAQTNEGCGDGGDGGGGGNAYACSGGGGGAAISCYLELVEIEISYDGGLTWIPFWSEWLEVCVEENAE